MIDREAFYWPPVTPDPRALPTPTSSLAQSLIKILFSAIPQAWKPRIYETIIRAGPRICTRAATSRSIYRLPFDLVLKISYGNSTVEADALRITPGLHGVHAPHLIDSAVSSEKFYLVTTWIAGDMAGQVWDDLLASDKSNLVTDLRGQLRAMRLQTISPSNRIICNASGGPMDDPRIPWVAEEGARTFSSCQSFSENVWIGLNRKRNCETLRPLCEPVIQRDVPIVFSHGDLLPKNLIFPGGLDHWRAGLSRICIIDWECAGWMPTYWDALKATWMTYEDDEEWLQMVAEIFPECATELDVDFQWRTRSNVTIL